MLRAEKEQIVADLTTELGGAASILLTDLSGMDVETMNGLRAEFRKAGVKYQVAKNTLVKLAVKGTPAEAMGEMLAGPTALAWHPEEPSLPAKIVKDFLKDNKNFTVKGGYIDGDAIPGEDAVKTLADMPSKDQLRAQLLGLIKQVPGKFLALLITPQRQFLAVLKAYEDKLKEEGGEA